MSESYLKETSLINENVDMKLLTPVIQLVQDLFIHPILGTDLYEEIISQIGSSSVSANNQTLLDNYILPCMRWYVMCKAAPGVQYQYTNIGVRVASSEKSQAADLQQLQFIMDSWENNAEEYAQRATNFLKANTDTYPKYISNGDEADDIHPKNTNYTSSLFLDDDEDCCNEYP